MRVRAIEHIAHRPITAETAPGTAFLTAEGSAEVVAISLYLYLFGETGAAVKDEWTALLADRFPQPDVVS